jgi:hypothetical protein
LSETEVKTSLAIIDWVISKTQTGSLKNKTENLTATINKCVAAIRQFNPKFTTKEFVVNYPNISGKLIARSTVSNLNDWCIIP